MRDPSYSKQRESGIERELREREEQWLNDEEKPSEEADERRMPPLEEVLDEEDLDDEP